MSGIEEFEQLVLKAEKQLGTGPFDFNHTENGRWDAIGCGPTDDDIRNVTFAEMIAHLQKLAKPKKPETVTITIPYFVATQAANARWISVVGTAINNACMEAIKPYEEQRP